MESDDASSRAMQQGQWYVDWLWSSQIVFAAATLVFLAGSVYTGGATWLPAAGASAVAMAGFHYHRRSIEATREVYDDVEL